MSNLTFLATFDVPAVLPNVHRLLGHLRDDGCLPPLERPSPPPALDAAATHKPDDDGTMHGEGYDRPATAAPNTPGARRADGSMLGSSGRRGSAEAAPQPSIVEQTSAAVESGDEGFEVVAGPEGDGDLDGTAPPDDVSATTSEDDATPPPQPTTQKAAPSADLQPPARNVPQRGASAGAARSSSGVAARGAYAAQASRAAPALQRPAQSAAPSPYARGAQRPAYSAGPRRQPTHEKAKAPLEYQRPSDRAFLDRWLSRLYGRDVPQQVKPDSARGVVPDGDTPTDGTWKGAGARSRPESAASAVAANPTVAVAPRAAQGRTSLSDAECGVYTDDGPSAVGSVQATPVKAPPSGRTSAGRVRPQCGVQGSAMPAINSSYAMYLAHQRRSRPLSAHYKMPLSTKCCAAGLGSVYPLRPAGELQQ